MVASSVSGMSFRAPPKLPIAVRAAATISTSELKMNLRGNTPISQYHADIPPNPGRPSAPSRRESCALPADQIHRPHGRGRSGVPTLDWSFLPPIPAEELATLHFLCSPAHDHPHLYRSDWSYCRTGPPSAPRDVHASVAPPSMVPGSPRRARATDLLSADRRSTCAISGTAASPALTDPPGERDRSR